VELKNLLCDRDGIIIIDKQYLSDPDQVELLPHVVEGLKRFSDSGVQLFLVSNQSGVARGMMTKEDVDSCNQRVADLLEQEGIKLSDSVYCAHHPDESCNCRKPAPGLWELLQQKHNNLTQEGCVVVGDKDSDILFGKNIGCKTARILSDMYPNTEDADYTVTNLNDLADILL